MPVLLTALVAIAWIGMVAWAIASGAWTSEGLAAVALITVLGILDLAALGSAAWWLRRQAPPPYVWAVLVLVANAALTLTDQMGWVDTLYLALTLTALGSVLLRTRWYWRRAARRGIP